MVFRMGAMIFAILFTVILTTLRRVEAFPAGASVTLAAWASLLPVVGIVQTFGVPTNETEALKNSTGLNVLLLPYTVMGVAVLRLLLLLLLGKTLSGREKALHRLNR
jgi:hypothetical protein